MDRIPEENMPGVDFDIVRCAAGLIWYIGDAIEHRMIGTEAMENAERAAKKLIKEYAKAYPKTVERVYRHSPAKAYNYKGSQLP